MENRIGHLYESKERTDDVNTEKSVTFDELLLSDNVLQGLKSSGFHAPSPIQLKAIPLGRCGLDMVVQAKSGTGKTCVFSVIALESVDPQSLSLQAIVLAPTREIALQIHSVMSGIGRHIADLRIEVFIGGTEVSKDRIKAKKCHIAIGSPGRIKQLVELEILSVKNVRLFVLDEADKLVEEGTFQTQINWIYSTLPGTKQMLAVSATYPQALAEFLKCYMCQPQFVQLNPTDPSLLGLQQYYYVVGDQCLPHVMFEQKTQSIIELFTTSSFQQALVFSNFHSRAHSLSQALNSAGWPSTYISGNLDQPQRIVAINKLKDFKCRVLISTDLTSRGIDAYHVDLVVNMDVPLDWETYMHRIGRAGRFGSRGTAFTLIGSKREEENLLAIAAQCSAKICKLESLSFVSRKSDLSGQINNLEQQMTGLHIKTQTKSLSTEFLGYQAEPDTNGMNGHVAQQKARSHPKAKGEIQDTNVTEELALTTDESSSESDHDTPAQPLIPSLQELLQSSMHLRKNVHCRNMSHLELLADLEYFKKHGEMAPPPYREDADTRNVQAKPRSNAKAVQRTDKANGRDTSIEPVSKQLLNTSSKTTAQSSQVKVKTNGQNGSQNTGPDARRVTTNSNEKAQHARKTQERKPSPPHSRPIRRDSTCTSSTSSTEVAEGSIPYEPQVLNNPRQYQTQQAASPVCSNCQCVSPYFVYEDDREFAAYVQRHAAWYARHYVELSYKSVLS